MNLKQLANRTIELMDDEELKELLNCVEFKIGEHWHRLQQHENGSFIFQRDDRTSMDCSPQSIQVVKVGKLSALPKIQSQEPAKQEPAKQEPAKQEPAKQEPAKQEPAKQEPAKQEPAKQEPAKQEPAKQEPGQVHNLSASLKSSSILGSKS